MRRLSRLRLGAALCTSVALAPTLLTQSAAHADPSSYSPTIGVSAGVNENSQIPITVTLPAPGGGIRVAQLTFSWDQPPPTIGTAQTARLTVDTPECVADQDCVVSRTLSTARMVNNGSRPLGIAVSDGTQLLGTSSVYLNVNNPKPSAAFTVPADNTTTGWGMVTLSADAAPGSGRVPLAGVRFYTNSTGRESDPYVFDDSAPYSVEVPTADIAATGGFGFVYAVAEDVEGNLTTVTYSGQPPTMPMQRRITVSPPPDVAFTDPVTDDVAAGSTTNPPLLRWTAKIPDVVPSYPSGEPYLKRVEVLIDGTTWLDMPYDVSAWYSPTPKPRSIDFGLLWQPDEGPTPGPHVATLRVTTSQGMVAVIERRFVVNDGVVFGPVLDAGHQVANGYVVTAGTAHKLTMTVRGKVDHAALMYWNMHDQANNSYVNPPNGCALAQQWDCPDQVTVTSDWTAPKTAGRYVLTWETQPLNDTLRSMTRTIVVQARGAMSAHTTTPTLQVGRRATVTGVFTRTDTGHGVAGAAVLLEWRRAGTTTWVPLTSKTTDSAGRVTASPLERQTGYYRWVTKGVVGKVSGATSSQVTVKIYS